MFLETPLIVSKINGIKCSTPDIPMITLDNAILYTTRRSSSVVEYGLMLHKGQYYYFEQYIGGVCDLSKYNRPNQFSYKIHFVTNKLAKKMISGEFVQHWELVFSSFFYYGKVIIIQNMDSNIKSVEYYSKFDRGLVIPLDVSPTCTYKVGMTIGEFFRVSKIEYPYDKSSFRRNKQIYREHLINMILN